MKKIFSHIFFIYGFLVLIPAFILLFTLYFIVFSLAPKKQAPHIAHRYVSHISASLLFLLFFIRLKIKHKDYIDPKQTYVFISNHQSQLDIPAFALSCKNTFRFLAKAELMKVPVIGYVIKRLYISVDRGDKNDRARSMENMMASLRENISVFICVEGTRNKTDKPLLDFKDGAFRLAIEAQVPLAVLTVKDSAELLPAKRNFELLPGTLHAEWSKPIETKGMTMEDLPALKEKARNLMMEVLKKDT
jgi:1-acyl-sn-glycerol-3-phosphate acyltransferase